jgi:hypothetical protein
LPDFAVSSRMWAFSSTGTGPETAGAHTGSFL